MQGFTRLPIAAALLAVTVASGAHALGLASGLFPSSRVSLSSYPLGATAARGANVADFVPSEVALPDAPRANPGRLRTRHARGGAGKLCSLGIRRCTSPQVASSRPQPLPASGPVSLEDSAQASSAVVPDTANATVEVGTLALLGTAILSIAGFTRSRKRASVQPDPPSVLPAA